MSAAVISATNPSASPSALGASPLWLTREPQAEIGSVVLAAPAGVPDEAFRQVTRPVLMLAGPEDKSDAGDRYRALLPDCTSGFFS